MTARIIDGRAIAAALRDTVAARVAALGWQPGLVVVLVGEDPASAVYVRNKDRAAAAAGIAARTVRLPAETSEAALLEVVAGLNADPAVDGILVQLPLPSHIRARRVIEAIDPAKDVDGFHPVNVGRLQDGLATLAPCTPRGVMALLAASGIALRGARATVLGRSAIVGKPMAALLTAADATVTLAHSRTRDLAAECRRAEVLVAAVGRGEMVRGDWIAPGAVVIDVGINRLADGRLVGDVAYAEAAAVAGAVTPVAGRRRADDHRLPAGEHATRGRGAAGLVFSTLPDHTYPSRCGSRGCLAGATEGQGMAGWAWWQRGVVYQVYPRSFQDSDADGTGDLRGIIARLHHLVWLGVDAVWISPVYPSPMTDFGYDVSDYCDIDPLFGTLADMDALIAAAHARGLRVILDYVPNHTSDRHPWFLDSRRGRDDARRDWYLWRDPAPDGGPPNNWLSNFGGPRLDSGSRQRPVLLPLLPADAARPELAPPGGAGGDVRGAALLAAPRRGRVPRRRDVAADQGRSVPRQSDQPSLGRPRPRRPAGAAVHRRRPEVQDVVAGMRAVLDEFADRVLIGELYLPIDRLVAYYGRDGGGAQLPFNFSLLLMQGWDATPLADIITRYEAALPPGGWPNWVLGNHDRPRIASRVGLAQARVAALMLLTLRGTPTIYMGDELGMLDTPIPADEVQDPAEKRQPGRGQGRDPERTPFPWEAGPGAGFTTGQPWLRTGTDMPLSVQRDDPGSMVSLYREVLALRRRFAALSVGAVEAVAAHEAVLSWRRVAKGEAFLVVVQHAIDAGHAA